MGVVVQVRRELGMCYEERCVGIDTKHRARQVYGICIAAVSVNMEPSR